MQGFGALPPGEGVNPDATTPPDPLDAKKIMDDVHRIAEKYDGPPIENVQPFNLAAGVVQKIDYNATPFNSIIVSVTTGTLKVWFGDYTLQAAATAHLNVPSGNAPVQYMFSTNGRIVSFGNDPTAVVNAVGTLWIERL